MRGQRAVHILAPIAVASALCACDEAPPLSHQAYVWQRAWTGAVQQAVSDAPRELTGLRVLALEVEDAGRDLVWPEVNAQALARADRPVTAVVRIDGARPLEDFSLARLWPRLDSWRAAGVHVVGVEIDHDCATARLPEYAAWLQRSRPPAPLRWSITALPTWSESSALSSVISAVDEVVLQVHAIRAPRLFDADTARAWLDTFGGVVRGRRFLVALPTYSVDVRGAVQAADPADVQALLRDLERRPVPGLRGVAWFRLPVQSDTRAWAAPTLRAVIRSQPLEPDVAVRLRERAPNVFDVVLENAGTLDGAWPDLLVTGDIAAVDLVRGYETPRRSDSSWRAPQRELRPGQRIVVGWATGKEVIVDAR